MSKLHKPFFGGGGKAVNARNKIGQDHEWIILPYKHMGYGLSEGGKVFQVRRRVGTPICVLSERKKGKRFELAVRLGCRLMLSQTAGRMDVFIYLFISGYLCITYQLPPSRV